VFDWAKYRTAKGAVKIHLLLDHDGLLPEFAIITDGKASDIRTAHKFFFPKGSMVVFDRGYCDYDWFAGFAAKGFHLVTRLKDNASWVALEFRPIAPDSNVRHDDIVVFAQHNTSDNERFLRRVVWWDETHKREYFFLTNHLDLDAAVVADVYKQRWQIELMFETWTWRTPTYVIENQSSIGLNEPLAGSSLIVSARRHMLRRRCHAESMARQRTLGPQAVAGAESTAKR
jgi:hypothetical protein